MYIYQDIVSRRVKGASVILFTNKKLKKSVRYILGAKIFAFADAMDVSFLLQLNMKVLRKLDITVKVMKGNSSLL